MNHLNIKYCQHNFHDLVYHTATRCLTIIVSFQFDSQVAGLLNIDVDEWYTSIYNWLVLLENEPLIYYSYYFFWQTIFLKLAKGNFLDNCNQLPECNYIKLNLLLWMRQCMSVTVFWYFRCCCILDCSCTKANEIIVFQFFFLFI